MKKKLLSIITSASIVASTLGFGVYASPSVAGVADSSKEYTPMPEINSEAISDEFLLGTSEPSPIVITDSSIELNSDFGTPDFYNGTFLMSSLPGEGTEESPYLISDSEDLYFMADSVNKGTGSSAHYKLMSDIDLGGNEWNSIGHYNETDTYSVSFCGVFDGNGHTVSNFKITDSDTPYIGLFGLVVGGTIKNLNVDNAVIDVNSSNTERLYVGIIAGRFVTSSVNNHAELTGCNVTNSSITVASKGTIRAGGIAGTVLSGEREHRDSSIFLAFLKSDCDINISTTAKNQLHNTLLGKDERHMVIAGGIVGYLHAEDNSFITVINSSANSDIVIDAMDTIVAQAQGGGAFGDVRTVHSTVGGNIKINSCFSTGSVTAMSYHYPYIAGGFVGQLYSTKSLLINDCYSASDVNGKYAEAGMYVALDPTAGGFLGQHFFENYVLAYGNIVKNCYGSGNVIDLNHTETTAKDTSFVGGFMGWTDSGVFENCYRFDAQHVWGSDLNYTDNNIITVLSEEDSRYLDKYVGFDMENTWEMNPEAEYFYPTLREKSGYVNFISEDISFTTGVFGVDGRVSAPSDIPEKAPTTDKEFVFNYWSLSENGTPFNFGSDTLSESTNLYAVFKPVPRKYTVRFLSDGSDYVSPKMLDYGTAVKAPSGIPEKDDDSVYYYTFMHWSDSENGNAYKFDDYSVVLGDMTFYAVFDKTDKSAWTGGIAEEFAYGSGTKDWPYIINSADEFALFAQVINEGLDGYTDAYYSLGASINLGGKNWVPIGNSKNTPFSAYFDGKGYSVSNFKIVSGQYGGLFGFVNNGTIKNVNVTNFEINYRYDIEDYPLYAGGVAAYVTSKRGVSEISGVSVSADKFVLDAKVDYVYAGNIVGHGCSYAFGSITISNCYATSPITVVNETGYNYVGGIVGSLETWTNSLSSISYCYNIGDISSTSYHSSHAGGLVGYLYSNGMGFTGGDTEDDSNLSGTELAEDDYDMMLINSFAIANVYSLSTNYISYAGYLAGECNTHAGVENIFYPSNIQLSIIADRINTTQSTYICKVGSEAPKTVFTNQSLLEDYCSFDFLETWTFIDNYSYPVLKSMVSEKPEVKILFYSFEDGKLNATIQALADVSSYTVVIGVYNERNQLIKAERHSFTDTDKASEIKVSYNDMEKADYIKVSAIEKYSLKPLFEEEIQKL